jgi:hypothetical protein
VSFDPETEQLRVWDRVADDLVERVIDGRTTPCLTLDGHWVVAPVDGTPALRLARDPGGLDLWPTPVEAERNAAAARIAELEELRRRGG